MNSFARQGIVLATAFGVCVFVLFTSNVFAVNCEYDDQGRLVRADYGVSGSIAYAYDAAGNLTDKASYDKPTYTITTAVEGNGAISPSGTVIVEEAASQTFQITADSGYGVSDVLVDGTSVGALSEYTFENVTTNHTITAKFIQAYAITASAEENGSISPSGAVSVNQGASQAFAITANDGYAVNDVLVDGASQGAVSSYTFEAVAADHTIAASFKRAKATLTMNVKPLGSGSATPASGTTVTIGESFSISASPASGFSFVEWQGTSLAAIADAKIASPPRA